MSSTSSICAASAFTCCIVYTQPCKDKCSLCLITRYCCSDHQKKHWSEHKKLCAWLREELDRRPLPDQSTAAKELRKKQLAVVYWRRLAGEGDVEAQFCLGSCYYYGDGVDRVDQKEAVKY